MREAQGQVVDAARETIDFGWRRGNRLVGVLPARDLRLTGGGPSGLLAAYSPDAGAAIGCPQCGVCTASCDLADDDRAFPRVQVHLAQLGAREALLADPAVWYCHDCGDCSTRCPSGMRPGRIMGSLRQLALEHYAPPRRVGALVNRPGLVGLLYAGAALVVAAAVTIGGSWSPSTPPVIYASFLPRAAIDVLFLGATALAVVLLGAGVSAAWRAWRGPSPGRLAPAALRAGIRRALADLATHRSFGSCGEHRWRRAAHWATVAGFVALALLAGVTAGIDLLGGTYPFPVLHPMKVIGNVAGLLLLAGVGLALARQIGRHRRGEPASAFDWLLLVHLLLVVLTGFAAEFLRYGAVAAAAYPVYFVHLTGVLVLLVLLPWSKLGHAAYRTAALVLRAALRANRAPAGARPAGGG
jgi:quinone-modifying oxidoreductase subunit QmoC